MEVFSSMFFINISQILEKTFFTCFHLFINQCNMNNLNAKFIIFKFLHDVLFSIIFVNLQIQIMQTSSES